MFDISGFFNSIFYSILIIILLLIGSIGLNVNFYFKINKIETTKRINPDFKLITDGKKIDTIFIYKK